MFWTKFELLFLEIWEKSICSTLGTLGQLHYTILVFQFDYFSLDFTVDIGPKHHLLSLYRHGRTGNIFSPTFWHDFHFFCNLVITTAVGTTSQSMSIRFNLCIVQSHRTVHLPWLRLLDSQDVDSWLSQAMSVFTAAHVGQSKIVQTPNRHYYHVNCIHE